MIRRAAAAACGLALAFSGLLPAAVRAQDAAEAPVAVEVTTLAPRAPLLPSEPLQIAGRLVNNGLDSLEGLQVRLRVGDRPITSRSELALADTEPPATSRRGTPVEPVRTELGPGESTTFDVRMPVRLLRLHRLGVYPLVIEVRGRLRGESGLTGLGLAATFLPWFPDGPPAPTRIAWLWPLVDQPRRAPREVMVDDELHSLVAPQGRLDRLLRAGVAGSKGACDPPAKAAEAAPPPPAAVQPCRREAVPLTWAVDPDLLFSLAAMRSDYKIRRSDRETDLRPPSAAARKWIQTLRSALSEGPSGTALLPLPYADPDVVALTRRGTGLRDDVAQARLLGRTVSNDILGRVPQSAVAWPPSGRLTGAALDAIVAGGSSAVVLDETALPPPPGNTSQTPGARAEIFAVPGDVVGLVIDDTLSRLLAPPTTGWQGPRLAEQRWLVETAMIAAEAPSVSRTLVVAPTRRADLVPAVAAAALMDTGRVPWLCPVPLDQVAAGTESCSSESAPAEPRLPQNRGELEPPQDRDGELRESHLDRVQEVSARAEQFTGDVLKAGTQEAKGTGARLLRARARTESSAWRGAPADGRALLDLLEDDIDDLRGRVRLQTGRGVLTLTSNSGVLSVNVVNELDQVVTVGVRLEADNEARLSTEEIPVVEVGPRLARQVDVRVQARTSGQFAVRAQLVDRDRREFGPATTLVVRSTAYGRVALAVTGLGAGVLLIAVGVRVARKALGRRRAP
ncbi:MAG TPA: DUF6049 family protein [Mycobacteriales bacterium]|nr:DUF6049 family protein [Mycobacteriales bacterium]